ncbi:MAG TPA: fibronectin type III domain-containing protein [bacterium]|nr:fibronectin type III domain-containing protein [bacterium]
MENKEKTKDQRTLLWAAMLWMAGTLCGAEVPAPAHLKAGQSQGKLVLQWTAPKTQGLQGYRVYWKRPGADRATCLTPQPIRDTEIILGHFEIGKTYEVGVSSVDAKGVESPQARLKVVPKDPTLPVPEGFQVEWSAGQATLRWDERDLSTIAGYNLYLADEDGNPVRKLNDGPVTESRIDLKNLKKDKLYRFLLTSTDRHGWESLPAPMLEFQPQALAVQESRASLPAKPSAPPNGQWFLTCAAGLDLPLSGRSTYSWGPAGSVGFGFEWFDGLSLGLEFQKTDFSTINDSGFLSETGLAFLPVLRLCLLPKGVRPYLSAEGGLDLGVAYSDAGEAVSLDPDVRVAAGFQFEMAKDAYAFVEGGYNLILSSNGTGRDVPLSTGLMMGL